jgi:hypothetical protein
MSESVVRENISRHKSFMLYNIKLLWQLLFIQTFVLSNTEGTVEIPSGIGGKKSCTYSTLAYGIDDAKFVAP